MDALEKREVTRYVKATDYVHKLVAATIKYAPQNRGCRTEAALGDSGLVLPSTAKAAPAFPRPD
jgi:hypothetical protein